jgi:serine protease
MGRSLLVVVVTAVLVTFALAVAAAAAPDGVPGPPDQPGGGEPPVAGVVRPMTNGDSNAARGGPGGPQKTNNLKYSGGPVQTATQVYLVFWGSQWSTADPVALRLHDFFSGLYGAQDNWSTSTTQYCSGAPNGSTTCPSSATFITHASSPSPLANTWFDASPVPVGASQSQLAAEARSAASHFSLSSDLLKNAQIVVVTPSGAKPQGFGTSYCAWHSYTSNAAGTIAYTNLPYIPDAGAACGANFVTAGANGALDGVTIVEGHEYAETVTDPLINAWKDQQGAENADKCAWISPGQAGGAKSLGLTTGSFAVQGLWSNAAGGCVNSYP